jgi:hypothetical protein
MLDAGSTKMLRILIRLVGLSGVVLFGVALLFTFYVPGGVEGLAQDFIKERIEKETCERIDSLTAAAKESKLGELAQRIIDTREHEVEQVKDRLREKVYEKSAAVIAEMRDLNCECRKKVEAHLKSGMESRLSLLQATNEELLEFMQMKYMEIATNLTRDFRIFAGSNLLVFVLLLSLSFLKPRATAHLYLPGVLLVITTIICSYFYLFEQNWFFTILYNDYVGFGYLSYVALLFGVFSDIIFNKAQITTAIINAFLEAIGSALTVVPC